MMHSIFDRSTGTLSAEVTFIPEGVHDIAHMVGGAERRVRVSLAPPDGPAVTAMMQQALDDRLSENVGPWVSFDSQANGPSSGKPTRFRYEPGRGVVLAVEWSLSGQERLTGGEYRYFVPLVLLDASGAPLGVPKKGPIGSLVNDLPFIPIQSVAASMADGEVGQADDQQETAHQRLEKKAEALVASGEASCFSDALAMAVEQSPDDYKLAGGTQVTEASGDGPDFTALERRGTELVSQGLAADVDEGIIIAANERPELYS